MAATSAAAADGATAAANANGHGPSPDERRLLGLLIEGHTWHEVFDVVAVVLKALDHQEGRAQQRGSRKAKARRAPLVAA